MSVVTVVAMAGVAVVTVVAAFVLILDAFADVSVVAVGRADTLLNTLDW